MVTMVVPRIRAARPGWARVARWGHIAWFFGNLYEALVGVPQLLADASTARKPSLVGTGSPVRYYAPLAPLLFGSSVVAIVDGWRAGDDKRLLIAGAGSLATATGLSIYLIGTVNVPLLASPAQLTETERRRLIAIWHRINVVRLIAIVGSAAALARLHAAE